MFHSFGDSWDLNTWSRLIIRKEASEHLIQRKSLLIGVDPVKRTNVSMEREVLSSGHYHVSGRTGVGKTQTVLLNLALQLIRGFRWDDGTWSIKAPVIFLDLKGDHALFHALKHAAEQDGRTFRFLTTKPNTGYYFFDPFQCFSLRHATAVDLASDWVKALGLDNGIVYAGKYFTDHNIVLLKDAVAEMLKLGKRPSLGQLLSKLEALASQPGKKDAMHIRLCIDLLAEYPQVNADLHAENPYPRIDVLGSLYSGDVLYFLLPCLRGGSPVRQIAALALSTIVQATEVLRELRHPVGPIYVFIDEFYHIAGQAFGDLLSMARDLDLNFILANQTQGQLKAHDPELPQVVRANTNVEQMFSAEDIDEIRFLQESAGKGPALNVSRTYGDRTTSVSYSVMEDWLLALPTIQEVSDTENRCFFKPVDGKPSPPGQRVRIVQTLYPLTKLEYGQYRLMPLPAEPAHRLKHSPGVVDDAKEGIGSAEPSPNAKSRFNVYEQQFQNRLAEKFAELAALEGDTTGP